MAANCKHWRQAVNVGDYTILASGSSRAPGGIGKAMPGPKESWPTLGVYLDRGWLSHLGGIAATGCESPIESWWPFILVDWPDFGAIRQDYFASLIRQIVRALEDGGRVEVACQGGHGRTGTVLAGVLAVVESLSPEEAIESLRERYCDDAIEGHKQVELVFRLMGEEPPKPPKKARPVGEPKQGRLGSTVGRLTSISAIAGGRSTARTAQDWERDQCTCGHIRRNHHEQWGACPKCSCDRFRLGALAGEEC